MNEFRELTSAELMATEGSAAGASPLAFYILEIILGGLNLGAGSSPAFIGRITQIIMDPVAVVFSVIFGVNLFAD